MKTVLIVLMILLVLWLLTGWIFYAFAVRKKMLKIPAGKAGLSNVGASWAKYLDQHKKMKEDAMTLPAKEIELTSSDGLHLIAHDLESAEAKRIVICAHGYRANGYRDFAGNTRWMVENHCRTILIEQRCCGGSEGEYVTFGAKEKGDIYLWTKKIAEENPDLPIYLYGISMGSSSVLMTAGEKLPGNVKGMIADCGYSSMKDEMVYLADHWFHVPSAPILPAFDFWCRIRAHFGIADADAVSALKKAEVPVLFIHGGKDDFVPVENTERNAAACAAAHRVVIIPDAPHGMSALEDPDTYHREMLRFFQENDG